MKKTGSLRIVMLGQKHAASREGGVERVVSELCIRMARLGHRMICLNRGGRWEDDGSCQALSEAGVSVRSMPTLGIRGAAAVTSSFFAACLASVERCDVVHFHAEGPCAMMWIPKLLGKRCVATIHGLDHRRAKWGGLARAYIIMGEKMAVRLADEIIVLNHAEQAYFQQRYGRPTTYIPNGVSEPRLRPAQEIDRRFGLQARGYILFLGRLVPEKGLHHLIAAFRQVKTSLKLVIAGPATDSKGYLKRLRQLASGDERVMFLGFVQGRCLEELYSNAYLYVLPSEVEGMPLSLLEAMSYGNCCLVSDIPGCMEVVGDRAAVFRHGDADDLAQKLQALCDQEERVRSFREGAAEHVLTRFDWDRTVQETLAVYRKAVA